MGTRRVAVETTPTYTLQVGGTHTYFAGGVWVHNSCPLTGLAEKVGNYRERFLRVRPDLPSGFQVHHGLPQKYESEMMGFGINIHETRFLRGVDKRVHSDITKDWNHWYKKFRNAGQAPGFGDFIDQLAKIDTKYRESLVFP